MGSDCISSWSLLIFLLRSPLYCFSSHIPKSTASVSKQRFLSLAHQQNVYPEMRCIHLMLPQVYLCLRYVKANLLIC